MRQRATFDAADALFYHGERYAGASDGTRADAIDTSARISADARAGASTITGTNAITVAGTGSSTETSTITGAISGPRAKHRQAAG